MPFMLNDQDGDTETTKPIPKDARSSHLSPDEKWRSFPRVPHLLQYDRTKTYYARVKVNGKLVRRSLETDVWTTAKLRLVDFLKAQREPPPSSPALPGDPSILFSEALVLFRAQLANDTALKDSSKKFRSFSINSLLTSWPGLEARLIRSITPAECLSWAFKLPDRIRAQYFNNTLGTLKLILDTGIKEHLRRDGSLFENPAKDVPLAHVKPKQVKLPEMGQFSALVKDIRLRSGGWGPRVADTIELLAYSGMRAFSEAQKITWEDVDWKRGEITVKGDEKTGTKNRDTRRIPIIPPMADLLERLKPHSGDQPLTGKILEVRRCDDALKRACAAVGISRLTHHDLRHLFATRCIEAGVDIPTVARWLGHKDGGALAMKVYGHLRNEHSQEMARKVRF